VVPQTLPAPELDSQLLIRVVGELEDLAHEEGKEVQEEEVEGEMELPMAEIVLDVVPLVLEGVEDFILDFPSRPSGLCEFLYAVLVDGKARNPGVMVRDMAIWLAARSVLSKL